MNPRRSNGIFYRHVAEASLIPARVGAVLLVTLAGWSTNIVCAAEQTWEDTHNAFIETYEIPANSGRAIAIKDNIDIAGRVTSAGSLAMAENVARTDAFLIEKLRDAKFHTVGNTN